MKGTEIVHPRTPQHSEVVSKTRPGYIAKTKMAAASEFPTELATRPLGLIALMGLDINQKPLHKAIWESFSVNRHPERVPLSFRLLPIDHEFPKAKSKVTGAIAEYPAHLFTCVGVL